MDAFDKALKVNKNEPTTFIVKVDILKEVENSEKTMEYYDNASNWLRKVFMVKNYLSYCTYICYGQLF